jgi:hypothetical protein
MHRNAILAAGLVLAALGLGAQTAGRELNADVSGSGLLPVTWAAESPTLSHSGFDAVLGLEYDAANFIPLRLEFGYISASASRISTSGELYRGWSGLRFALLGGYTLGYWSPPGLGELSADLLGGGALTAAAYSSTDLAYAYPSLLLEPRLELRLASRRARGSAAQASAQGPWLALPIELMFRAGLRTLAPGLSLGWRYRMAASR